MARNETEDSTPEESDVTDYSETNVPIKDELPAVESGSYVYNILTMDDLVDALDAENVTVKSATEIALVKNIVVPNANMTFLNFLEGTYVIDFGGYTFKGAISLTVYKGNVTCMDSSAYGSGGIVSEPINYGGPIASCTPFTVFGGTLSILSGRYEAMDKVIFAYSGNIKIEGGKFIGLGYGVEESRSAAEFYAGMQMAEISGGTFIAYQYAIICENIKYGEDNVSVQNPLKISGGTFESVNHAIVYRDDISGQVPDIEDIIADDCVLVPPSTEQVGGEYSVWTEAKVQVFKTTGVEGFVYRLYEKALSRTPDYAGYANWVNQLKNKTRTGSDVAFGFFFSLELTNRNLTNKEFVTLLYNVFFDRAPDDGGMANWMSALERGASRKYIFSGIANSQEWKNLCGVYDIDPGSYTSDEPRDQNLNVTAFVQRLYKLCLNRDAEPDGINDWTAALNSGTMDGAHVAYGFFFSQEFINRNLSNSDYVEVLYKVLLDRDSDPDGKTSWVKQLADGADRMDVFRGFVHSPEFDQICADYGIVRGTI